MDAAFLRHGRFDYVIPIGLPDAEARWAIWQRYVPAGVIGSIDLGILVARSDGLTPADIEYAGRRASQQALAHALRSDAPVADGTELSTDDYVRALEATRATVSEQSVREFLDDIESFARL